MIGSLGKFHRRDQPRHCSPVNPRDEHFQVVWKPRLPLKATSIARHCLRDQLLQVVLPVVQFLKVLACRIAPMQLPRLRFLTASLDKTIRLWDTFATMKGHRREKCVVSFEAMQVVLPVFVLWKPWNCNPKRRFDPFDEEAENTNYFLSGCKMGDVKLWNLRGDCLRTYASSLPRSDDTAISSVKPRSMFIVSHQDGSTRLWEAWSGVCLTAVTAKL
jgi:WD40 repeat protein